MNRVDDGDLSKVQWRKSSYSTGGGSNCVLVATAHATIGIRDSKQGNHGPVLILSRDAWRGFTDALKMSAA